MPFGVAVIHADQNAVLDVAAHLDQLDPGLFERCQAGLHAGVDVHTVQQVVFVAALVIDEQERLRIGRPEGVADRAVLFRGQRAPAVGFVQWRYPYIEHAIARRDPRQPLAVGAQASSPAARRCGSGCRRIWRARSAGWRRPAAQRHTTDRAEQHLQRTAGPAQNGSWQPRLVSGPTGLA